MKNIQAIEFNKETQQIFENIKASLGTLKDESTDSSLFYKHYLYWHEIKSIATIFSLHETASIAHAVELLFDLVSSGKKDLAKIDLSCFTDAIDYIKASLDGNKQTSSPKDLDSLLEKIQGATEAISNQLPVQAHSANTTSPHDLPYIPTILIVEDEPINMTLLEASIKTFFKKVNIIQADSAEEGLFHFFTQKIDLIFLDIMMPVIDGNHFIAIIEKNIEKRNISNRCNIVVQTAIQSITQLTSLAKKECVQEIIRKPIHPNRIEECLTRYCIEPYQLQYAV